jgi:hypothetical protein
MIMPFRHSATPPVNVLVVGGWWLAAPVPNHTVACDNASVLLQNN